MMRLVVNDTDHNVENMPESWGELLHQLEREAAGRGEVVSAVRFDTVEEPSFAAPDFAVRPLGGIAAIEVETATPRALIDAGLQQGESAAEALAQGALRVSHAFRGSNVAAANAMLAELGEGVRSLMIMLDMLTGTLGVTLENTYCDGRPASALLSGLARQLEAMIDAQQAQDWATVADMLEYELQPAIGTLRTAFQALR